MNMICTYSGRLVDLSNPSVESIDINDIAHALSNICRFNGHTTVFYSVAAHSICISQAIQKQASPLMALHGLLHDASEAYIHDIISPFKHMLTEYKEIERQFQSLIYDRYGIPAPTEAEKHFVKTFDLAALYLEIQAFTSHPECYEIPKSFVFPVTQISNDNCTVASIFKDLFNDLIADYQAVKAVQV